MDEAEFYLTDLKSRFDKLKPNEYYLSYSGGKDSHFLYWFIKEYLKRTDIEIVGVNTYMEHHEILQRIKTNCDKVLLPKLKPMQIKEKYGIPCFSKFQDEMIARYQKGSRSKNTMDAITGENRITFKLNKKAKELTLSEELHKVSNKCCKVIKKDTLHNYEKESGKKAILGVRGSESTLRKSQYKSCFTKDKKFTPLYDLTDELLEKIIDKYNIEVPNVYKYINRTGCMGCPYGHRRGNTEKELSLINENQKKFVCEYFKESYAVLGINTEVHKQTTIDDYL
jgi:3'-phosphoadenosine 5'-phosphosulfate sulfotransferase (PAPS reductase)/FAD synthetase